MAAFNRRCDNAQRVTEKTFTAIVVINIDYDCAEPGWIEYGLTTLLIPVFPGRFQKSDCLYMIEVAEFVGVLLFYSDEGFSFYCCVSSRGMSPGAVILGTVNLLGAI